MSAVADFFVAGIEELVDGGRDGAAGDFDGALDEFVVGFGKREAARVGVGEAGLAGGEAVAIQDVFGRQPNPGKVFSGRMIQSILVVVP